MIFISVHILLFLCIFVSQPSGIVSFQGTKSLRSLGSDCKTIFPSSTTLNFKEIAGSIFFEETDGPERPEINKWTGKPLLKPKENGDYSHLRELDTGDRYELLLIDPNPKRAGSTIDSIRRVFPDISWIVARDIVDKAIAKNGAVIRVLCSKV